MSEEELSVSVRWKRPARRAIPILVGALSVGVSVSRLPEPRDRDAHATPVPAAREWSCTADELGRSFGMDERRDADGSRKRGRSAETARVVLLEERLTRRIIGAFRHVHDRLGYGHREPVYRDALAIELRKRGIEVVVEQRVDVWYDGQIIGFHRADLIADGVVVIDIVAGRMFDDSARAQLLNYLACSDIRVGVLLHFGPSPEFHRVIRARNRERTQAPPASAPPAPIRVPRQQDE